MIDSLVNWLLVTLYFVAATLTLPLLYQIIPKHESPGGDPLILLLIGMGVWSFTAAMQLALPLEVAKIYFLKLGGLGVSIAPAAWLVFSMEYTQMDVPHKLKMYTGFGMLAAIQNLFISTNELHNLYWSNITMQSVDNVSLLAIEFGPIFYAYLIYQVGLTIAGLGIMFYYAATRGTTYQSHARLLGLAVSSILVSAVVTYSSIGPLQGKLNVIPLGILAAEISLIVAIYRFDLMGLSPTERDQMLYEQEGIREAELLIESDEIDLPTVNIGEIASTVRDEFYEHPDYDNTSVPIAIDCDLTIPASESLLERMFYSLYENAAEHNTQPVEIHVSELAFEDGFAVEDDGKGIPDAYKDSVFEAGVSFSSDGSGNGLAVIDRIATGHRWDVKLTDSAEGGSRFEFTNVSDSKTD